MTNFKENCKVWTKGFITDPKKLVRYVVLFICCIVVVFQLSECFTKLYRPPITTHSHFDLNETVSYPAVTFCRDPPYKADVLRAHNLSYHPEFTIAWRNFDFAHVDLKELFENATYGIDEFFGQYGLDGLTENVDIISGIYFNSGQCHTMIPKVTTRGSWRNHGYSLVLTHTMESTAESSSEYSPGWHVFIHEQKENFTETNMQTSGRVEYMYIKSGEEVEIKLTATHFNMQSGRDRSCTDDINHSAIQCADICQWTKITDPIGCSDKYLIMDNETEHTPTPYDGNENPIPTLYSVEIEIMVKDFMSQKSGNSKQVFEKNCNSPEEFCQIVWSVIQPYIEKAIIYNDETQCYEWSHRELDLNDLEKFVIFQDKVSKRTYEVLAVSKKLLQAWKNKRGIICFVHVYGTVLKKKQHYEQAFKDVIHPGTVDRSGAISNMEVFKCIDQLKALHSELIATEASWLRWANWILKQQGHEREILMRQDPPTIKPNLLELFKIARSEPEHIQKVRNDIAE